MKQQPPVAKNDEITLTVDALSSEGQGIGRVEGYAVFVTGALPGETVRAHVMKVAPNCAFAKLLSVETPSPDRVEPACPVYAACGGCVLQHLAYPAQLRLKRQTVVDALTRIGGIENPNVLEPVGMDAPWRYRNKGSFPFGKTDAVVRFGFFQPRSHRLVPLTDCPIQDARILEIANRIAEWANTYRVSVYDETTHRGILRHAMIRASEGGTMAVIVTTTNQLKHREALTELLADVTSVYQNVNPDDTNVIFGREFQLLSGEPVIRERIAELGFSVSPQSFLQVNAVQTARLYGEAVQLLAVKPGETVVDAYCGIGTISLLIAREAGRVIGVESVPEAIEDAKKNARENGIGNAEFLCGAVETVLPRLIQDGLSPDAIVLDPPRKGAEPGAIEAILKSGVNRLVYVSCNPATLARDCKLLTEGGFSLVSARPVDMFPHTAHVETVVLLSRVREYKPEA